MSCSGSRDGPPPNDELTQERDFYRREYNQLGARLLRLQDEQSRALREARRSRMLAKLIGDAYRLTDKAAAPGELALMMCHAVIADTLWDRVAILRRLPGGDRFAILAAAGMDRDAAYDTHLIATPPPFLFTTVATGLSPVATELTRILETPFVLWSYDQDSGFALIVGNRTEGNIHRPFEADDRELVDGALSVFKDIVARKQSEYELRQAKLDAEAAGRAQARFLARLSHELRTPMNAILGFSDMILMARDFDLDLDGCIAYGRDIQEAGGYLLALIEDILDFSAFGLEAPIMSLERADALDLIAKADQSVRPMAERKGVAIEARLPKPVPNMKVDPVRMRQVLVNLIGNAVKFTPRGGRVIVSALYDPSADAVVFEIADNGVGMAPADLARAFDPFQQFGNADGDSANGGVGLGLTIAKTLVEAHGGELTLTSAPGAGTTARVSLPLAPATAAPQGPA